MGRFPARPVVRDGELGGSSTGLRRHRDTALDALSHVLEVPPGDGAGVNFSMSAYTTTVVMNPQITVDHCGAL